MQAIGSHGVRGHKAQGHGVDGIDKMDGPHVGADIRRPLPCACA